MQFWFSYNICFENNRVPIFQNSSCSSCLSIIFKSLKISIYAVVRNITCRFSWKIVIVTMIISYCTKLTQLIDQFCAFFRKITTNTHATIKTPTPKKNCKTLIDLLTFAGRIHELFGSRLIQLLQEVHKAGDPAPGVTGGPVRAQTLITLIGYKL